MLKCVVDRPCCQLGRLAPRHRPSPSTDPLASRSLSTTKQLTSCYHRRRHYCRCNHSRTPRRRLTTAAACPAAATARPAAAAQPAATATPALAPLHFANQPACSPHPYSPHLHTASVTRLCWLSAGAVRDPHPSTGLGHSPLARPCSFMLHTASRFAPRRKTSAPRRACISILVSPPSPSAVIKVALHSM